MKIVAIAAGFLLALLAGFHFWFNAHAKGMIEDLVEARSNGKVKLKVEKLRFNYFTRKMELQKAVFYNTDTATGTTAYHFSIDKMYVRVKAILPIVFNNSLLIDSLALNHPHIQVTRLRPSEKQDKKLKKDVSIPEEMGKVYKSIQDALNVLKVKRFQIDDGTFLLVNKIDPDQEPLRISNINFYIDNLQVDTSKLTGQEKILFSDNVVLKSVHQDILFPDKRHRLSFRQFRINLQNKLVEFDSCTIAAVKTDSAVSSFSVFFDKLRLTNIDFDTLYRAEVIKADSVYCVNPSFVLEVETGKKKSGKPPPKLENIIKQLTGDLDLGFVVVQNANFDIRTLTDGNPTSYIFSNNNFEMQGLSIQQYAAKPVKVKSFAMAIRNYENFIKDSSYSIQFDSVLFNNDRITLSNFVFHKLDNGRILNTFNIPRFYLGGLSWDALVFDRKLKADQATMFNPYINYTASARKNKKPGRQSIFQSFGAVNEYMDLQYLDVVDGTIHLKLNNNVNILLEKANLSVQSHELLQSKKVTGLKNSLSKLDFENGRISAGNLLIELQGIRYGGDNNRLDAAAIHVRSKNNKTNAAMQGVTMQTVQVDELTGNIYAEGLKWKKADVKITAPLIRKDDQGPDIHLKDVAGGNTMISGLLDNTEISANLKSISVDEFRKKEKEMLILNGLAVTGSQLIVRSKNLYISADEYDIRDNHPSYLKQVDFQSSSESTNTSITVPAVKIIPRIQPLISGKIALDELEITKPVIAILSNAGNSAATGSRQDLPEINISSMSVTQPKINFTRITDKDTLSLEWHGDRQISNIFRATDLTVTKGESTVIAVDNARLNLSDFEYASPNGKKFSTGDGRVTAAFSKVKLDKKKGENILWETTVSSFNATNFRLDNTGKAKGSFHFLNAGFRHLLLNSAIFPDLKKLALANKQFQVNEFTGFYSDAVKKIQWYNISLNRSTNFITADSFSYVPAMERDSFIAKQSFQTDYINLRSGAIRIGPIDFDRFIRDTVLHAKSIFLDQLAFTSYRDKQLPFNAGIVKPLPVNMIKKIPLPLSFDTVRVENGEVAYTEIGIKTKEPGTIPVKGMAVRLLNFKNYDIKSTDSLDIRASGYLMDTAWIGLRVRESYADSLGGFLMTLRFKPANLTILNPVLIPLASVKIESGFLDTLTMRAIGREYLSLGEMKMFYHDLKVRFLKNGDETKKTFLTGLITFIANNFVVRSNNTSRTGRVFFIRNRDRSAINYLVKIAMSGIASSVGAKSNRKMMRKFKHELEKRNLPPVDLD